MSIWTKDWQSFTGHYEKEMVDVITKEGKQIDVCWPNAGFMNPCGEQESESIPYEQIDKVRLSQVKGWWNP